MENRAAEHLVVLVQLITPIVLLVAGAQAAADRARAMLCVSQALNGIWPLPAPEAILQSMPSFAIVRCTEESIIYILVYVCTVYLFYLENGSKHKALVF